jgi:hypothetical protein
MRTIEQMLDQEIYECINQTIEELQSNEALFCKYEDQLMGFYHYDSDGDPIDIFQYFSVTDWFADQLEEAGEIVVRDLLDFNVWGRTTFGQAIGLDREIVDIYLDVVKDHVQITGKPETVRLLTGKEITIHPKSE